MSIFDPHQLYYHRQKSTKKGQVIQKSPQPRYTAIDYSMIPQAINVLHSYGYEIFPPNSHAVKTYFEAFNIKETGLTSQTLSWTVNGLMNRFKATMPRLQAFIQNSPDHPKFSHLAIALTSVIFFGTGGHYTFRFYNDGAVTIHSSPNIVESGQPQAFMYGPNITNSQYYLASDYDTTSTSGAIGNIITRTRSSNTDLTGIINYANVNNKWSEIKSPSGLENNITVAKAQSEIQTGQITGYIMQGYLLIELN